MNNFQNYEFASYEPIKIKFNNDFLCLFIKCKQENKFNCYGSEIKMKLFFKQTNIKRL